MEEELWLAPGDRCVPVGLTIWPGEGVTTMVVEVKVREEAMKCSFRAQSLGSWAPGQLVWLCDLGRVPWSRSASFPPPSRGQEVLVTIAMSLTRS